MNSDLIGPLMLDDSPRSSIRTLLETPSSCRVGFGGAERKNRIN